MNSIKRVGDKYSQRRKVIKGAKFYGKLLGSDGLEKLVSYISRRPREYEEKYFDGDLFDIILSHTKNHKERKALKDSLRDKKITKLFCHWSETIKQIDGFILGSQKPSFQWNECFRLAIRLLKEIYSINDKSLKPFPLNKESDLVEIFKNLDTSAGAVNPGKKKKDSLPLIFKMAKQMKRLISSRVVDFREIFLPALPLHRAQISNYYDVSSKKLTGNVKQKDRLVWNIDSATVAIEGQFARPLINALRLMCDSYAGGMNSDEQRLFFERHCRGKNWIGVDFSSFDQTIPSWLIWEAFDVVKSYFPDSCGRELDWIRFNFINTKILLNNGELIEKHRGIPSGSYFTQIIGSMCNLIMLLTYLIHKFGYEGAKKELRSMQPRGKKFTVTTMGDDGLLFSYSKLDLNDMESYLNYNFGVIMKAEKSDFGGSTDDPHFLKRFWGKRYQFRDFVETWINTCHPEYFRNYDGYTPWHIIFAIYLTYEGTMRQYFTKQEIVQHIKDAGYDSTSFKKLKPQSLPGSVMFLLTERPGYLANQYELAEGSYAA